jgi:hypothetical protein
LLLLLLLLLLLEMKFKWVKHQRPRDAGNLLGQFDVGFKNGLTKVVQRNLELIDVSVHAFAENVARP